MKIVLVLTTLLVALIAGLFFGFCVSINPAFRKLSDVEYIRSMQEINRAILNPVFLACFTAPLLLYVVSGWLTYRSEGAGTAFVLVVTSGLIYFFAVFVVTGTKNVPLNEALDRFSLASSSLESMADFRKSFEGPWGQYHNFRTIANIVATILMLVGLTKLK